MPITNGQASNNGGGGGSTDAGATSIEVTSPDSSVTQVGQSSYNPTTKKLSVALQAAGSGGGMTNPMTSAGDLIIGGTPVGGIAPPVRLPKGTSGQVLTVDSLGSVEYDTAPYTKYDYPISSKSTGLTFTAGDEFLLCVSNPIDIVNYSLVFDSDRQGGLTQYGMTTIDFDLTRVYGLAISNTVVNIRRISSCSNPTMSQNQLNSLFSFKIYNLTAPLVVNGVTINTGQVIVTIILNQSLQYVGTNNSLYGVASTVSADIFGSSVSPNNNALLGLVTNIPAVTEELTQELLDAGVQASSPLAPLFSTYTNVANMINGNVSKWLNGIFQDSNIPATAITYLYSKFRYVDNVGGLDTNNGSYNAPYKTMKYSVENNPTGTIHVLMGQSTEAAFSIPANKTNIDVIAQGTRSALNGFTNKVTVLGTGAGSVRFQDLNFGGGLTRDATCTCGIYVYDGSIGAAGFTNSGNGYTEISQTDASNGVNNISAGTTVFYGGKVSAPSMTGTGTVVTFDNVGTVIGNGTMAAGGTLHAFETNWIAGATGHAISCVAGTVVTMQGCNFVRPNGTLASVSVSNYDIQNTDFDKANSILGTHVGNYDWYSRLALLNADTITTATKMLVRKATGEIAEQLIPTFNIPIQFNAPVSSLYSPGLTPTPLLLKSVSGGSQTTQMVQLCTTSGSITLDQLFNATVAVGKTLTYNGRLVVYNALTATNANYYINIQMIGVVGSTGQLVNLGDIVTTQLSKVQYAYTPVNIRGTYTNTGGTAIEAVGIRAQLLYGEANGTALVDTFFLQGTVT